MTPRVAFAAGVVVGAWAPLLGQLAGSLLAARAAGREWHRSDLFDVDLSLFHTLAGMTTPAPTCEGLETGIAGAYEPVLPPASVPPYAS